MSFSQYKNEYKINNTQELVNFMPEVLFTSGYKEQTGININKINSNTSNVNYFNVLVESEKNMKNIQNMVVFLLNKNGLQGNFFKPDFNLIQDNIINIWN